MCDVRIITAGNIMVPPDDGAHCVTASSESGQPAAQQEPADRQLVGAAGRISERLPEHNTGDGSKKQMTFIDFEYSDWAPRGFDWGNHFCE
jgi:thiamine kinase-like enzyme